MAQLPHTITPKVTVFLLKIRSCGHTFAAASYRLKRSGSVGADVAASLSTSAVTGACYVAAVSVRLFCSQVVRDPFKVPSSMHILDVDRSLVCFSGRGKTWIPSPGEVLQKVLKNCIHRRTVNVYSRPDANVATWLSNLATSRFIQGS